MESTQTLRTLRVKPGVPNSWTALFVLALVAATAAGVCAASIYQYMASRPLDLRPQSAEVAERLQRALSADFREVSATTATWRADNTVWSTTRFEAAVPEDITGDTATESLRLQFADANVDVVNRPQQIKGERHYAIESQGREVATVRLHGFVEREDWTPQTVRAAGLLRDALQAAGSVNVEPVRTEIRQSDAALWQYALLQAHFSSADATRGLTERVNDTIADKQIRVARDEQRDPSQLVLTVRYRDVECAEVRVVSGYKADPAFRLAALAVEFTGLDPDDIVRELYPDPEELPLDSSELNGETPQPISPPLSVPYTGPLQLAIIVDDGGYGGWITEEILAMPTTLTLSILPHAPFSYETAQRASALGFEVMLHMPMENVSGKTTYPGEITVNMDANQMLDLTNQAIADVPGAVGINNHTGSKFTSNAAAMRIFLDLIKDSGLFFIDSRTAKTACAYEVADEMEIPCAARDLFLDHESGPNYIRARFRQIIEIVKRQGSAIAICHFRKNTVPILKEMMPVFEQEGIEIVHASTMVR